VPRVGNVTAENLLKESKSLFKVIEESREADTPVKKRIHEFVYEEDDRAGISKG